MWLGWHLRITVSPRQAAASSAFPVTVALLGRSDRRAAPTDSSAVQLCAVSQHHVQPKRRSPAGGSIVRAPESQPPAYGISCLEQRRAEQDHARVSGGLEIHRVESELGRP
jgi:hypothetical protein